MKSLSAALVALLPVISVSAQTAAADSGLIEQVSREGIRYQAGSVAVLVEPGALSEPEAIAFAERMRDAVAGITHLLGAGLDAGRYGSDTLHVVVSEQVTISHVFGAYEHMAHPHAYLFLSPEKIRDGTAPYLHEATHLLAWRFGSLSLREGFASYVEARVSASLGVRAPGLFGAADTAAADARAAEMLGGPAAAAVLPHIGASGMPPPEITSSQDRRSRAAFYLLSQSFVQHLHRALGTPGFLEIYAAEDPGVALRNRTGRPLEEWKQSWIATLTGL